MARKWKAALAIIATAGVAVAVYATIYQRAGPASPSARAKRATGGDVVAQAHGAGSAPGQEQATTDDSRATPEPSAPMIAFVSDRDGTPHIYIMNPEGTNVRRLTNEPLPESAPTWSPDGQRLAFARDEGRYEEHTVWPRGESHSERRMARVPGWHVWVVNADGSASARLTSGDDYAAGPAWSPDGKKIAFVRESNIWVMNPDGSDAKPFFPPLPDARVYRSPPTWSPDGKKIIFVSSEGNPDPSARRPWYELWTANADGSNPSKLPLTWHGSSPRFGCPCWSPDGKTIAFLDSSTPYLARPDGSEDRPLLPPPGEPSPSTTGWNEVTWPTWSPDSKRIAFSAKRVTYTADPNSTWFGVRPHIADAEIYIVNADGTGLVNITNNPAQDTHPAWSPG